MQRIVDWLGSNRLVMAVIVLNTTALVFHEVAPRQTGTEDLSLSPE